MSHFQVAITTALSGRTFAHYQLSEEPLGERRESGNYEI